MGQSRAEFGVGRSHRLDGRGRVPPWLRLPGRSGPWAPTWRDKPPVRPTGAPWPGRPACTAGTAARAQPSFLFHLGDVVYDHGEDTGYHDQFYHPYKDYPAPIFAIPGMGQLLFTSITGRDYPVVQAITVISALLVIVVNLIVDLSYSFLDPRVTYE